MIMQQELACCPSVIRNAYETNFESVHEIAKAVSEKKIKNITIIGRGSSDNAGLCFKYITEIIAGIPVGNAHPSVTTMYGAQVNYNNHLVIAISQSGRSIDTLAVLDNAKRHNALTVAVTNDENSPLAKKARYHLYLNAGEEIALGATKTFSAELTVLYMLAIAISGKESYMDEIKNMPEKVQEILDLIPSIRRLAYAIKDKKDFIVLSRGCMQGVGKELALKFNQLCYCFCQFYSITDFMHGPIAMLDEGVNVILLAPHGECADNYLDISGRTNIVGANLYVLSDTQEVLNYAEESVQMPVADFLTSTFTYSVAVHLLSMFVATEKGIDPDNPRNLEKVIITK